MPGSINCSMEESMSYLLKEVSNRIDLLKTQLNKLWDEKGSTSEEILRISEEIDHLLNEHDRLLLHDERVS